MSVRARILLLALCTSCLCAPSFALAKNDDSALAQNGGSAAVDSVSSSSQNEGLQYLVPELKGSSTQISSGPREFLHRVSFSPGYGRLGEQEYFVFRFAYNPNSWL